MSGVKIAGPGWVVYGLFDSREPENPFYIGMSGSVAERAASHRNRSDGVASVRIKEIERAGATCTLETIQSFADKGAARMFEIEQIATRPGLINRDILRCRRILNGDERPDDEPNGATIKVLITLTVAMDAWLEKERIRRGLRSRLATIAAVLEDARA